MSRKNKNGSTTTYVQLAHNVRDEKTGVPKAQVLYTFGRQDSLDVEAIRRLIGSLSRFVSAETAERETSPLTFIKSAPLGGAYLLRALWEKIGIPALFTKALKDWNFSSPVEWAVFAMVANRALAPDSKRGVEE